MEFKRTAIPDVVLCTPTIFKDERGYFFESFKEGDLSNFVEKKITFCQDNESKSTKGVLRGLHYQLAPYAQAKLVRVIKGEVLDVAVDVRRDSKTFGQHVSVVLNQNNKQQLYIPAGFAHGFVVLSDEAIFSYKVDNFYNKESEGGILFSDDSLNIDWGLKLEELIISEKDQILPSFKNARLFESKAL